MFNKIVAWIKNHKFSSVLLVIVAFFLVNNFLKANFGTNLTRYSVPPGPMSGAPALMESKTFVGDYAPSIGNFESAPAPEVKERMVVQNSHLSLLVKKVNESLKKIKESVESAGGYMVESNLNNPQENASGEITVRVPSEKLDSVLDGIRNLAVKVVSENLQGTDVTDQYVDIEARIKILQGNKTRFEEIMNQAGEISDILNIQQQIMNLQNQIDSYKGQQNYLAKTAQMAKITIYLSTDEYELPYAPPEPWRPEVIFKQAVRSLVGNLRKLGTLVIWLAVYSVVIIPVAALIIFLKKRRKTFSPHN